MIKWAIHKSSNIKMKFRKCFMDIILVRSILNDEESFSEFKKLVECGTEYLKCFPKHIYAELIEGIRQMNMDNYD